MTALHFNYSYRDQLYPCTYQVQFDRLIVGALFGTTTIPMRKTDDPLRLARVVAHDILSKAGRDGRL